VDGERVAFHWETSDWHRLGCYFLHGGPQRFPPLIWVKRPDVNIARFVAQRAVGNRRGLVGISPFAVALMAMTGVVPCCAQSMGATPDMAARRINCALILVPPGLLCSAADHILSSWQKAKQVLDRHKELRPGNHRRSARAMDSAAAQRCAIAQPMLSRCGSHRSLEKRRRRM
jgi:hypothetical protein